MVKPTLHAELPLDGYERTFGTTTVTEIQNLSIYSVSLPLEPASGLKAVNTAFGADWPAPGTSTRSNDGRCRLLGLQSDQIFVLKLADNNDSPDHTLPDLQGSAYVTDQSDSWSGLKLQGSTVRTALERICPIDLHSTAFDDGAVTRTSMEHLATIIVRIDSDQFWLFSPTSSAKSFLHAVETSFSNITSP